MKPRPSTAWWTLPVKLSLLRPMTSVFLPRAPVTVRWHLMEVLSMCSTSGSATGWECWNSRSHTSFLGSKAQCHKNLD